VATKSAKMNQHGARQASILWLLGGSGEHFGCIWADRRHIEKQRKTAGFLRFFEVSGGLGEEYHGNFGQYGDMLGQLCNISQQVGDNTGPKSVNMNQGGHQER